MGTQGDSAREAAIHLCDWWGRVARFHRRMLPYHIELKGEVSPELPRVAIPAPVLSQAVFNLIRNAQNAMQGRAEGCITVRAAASADRGFVDLIVEDDGPGMSVEVAARCFEPFFSAQPPLSTTPNTPAADSPTEKGDQTGMIAGGGERAHQEKHSMLFR